MKLTDKTNRLISTGRLLLIGICLLSLTGCTTLQTIAGWLSYLDIRRYFHAAAAIPRQLAPYTLLTSEDPEQIYRKAVYLQKRNKHRPAVQAFKELSIIDPASAAAYNGMGVSYDSLGDFTRAAKAYQKALSLNPDSDYVYNNMGYSCLLRGEVSSAIAAFKKAIALNAEEKQYHNNLALAYAKNGQYDLALAQFRKAGDAAYAHANLARLMYDRGDYGQAKKYFWKALALAPGEKKLSRAAQASENLALISKAGDAEEEEEYRAIYDLRPAIGRPDQFGVQEPNPVRRHRPASIRITVCNGNGVPGMAAAIGEYLQAREYRIEHLRNAGRFSHRKTTIYYLAGYLQDAYRVAKEIPGYQEMVAVEEMDEPDVHIKILVGRDLLPYRARFGIPKPAETRFGG